MVVSLFFDAIIALEKSQTTFDFFAFDLLAFFCFEVSRSNGFQFVVHTCLEFMNHFYEISKRLLIKMDLSWA